MRIVKCLFNTNIIFVCEEAVRKIECFQNLDTQRNTLYVMETKLSYGSNSVVVL